MNSRLNKSSQKEDSEATVRLPTSHFTSTAQRYSLDRSTRLRESILSKMLPNMRNGWSNFPATTAQASSL